MKKYEYKSKTINHYETESELNKLGLQGWLVILIIYQNDSYCRFLLQREFKENYYEYFE